MDCSTPGFPVLHYLPVFAQPHVHWLGDVIQPSPQSPPSPPVLCSGAFSQVQLFATPQTVALPGSPSMGVSRQECCSELPCPSPGNLPNPGTEPWSLTSPALTGRFFTTSTAWDLSIFPNLMAFSNESALHIRWPRYWSFSISPSNEYSGLISFRIDWFDLTAVKGILKSLIQQRFISHSSGSWKSNISVPTWVHPVADCSLLTVSLYGGRAKDSLRSLYKYINLIHEDTIPWLNTPPRPHFLIPSHWGSGFQYRFWENITFQSVTVGYQKTDAQEEYDVPWHIG